jgi:hypothetical protein
VPTFSGCKYFELSSPVHGGGSAVDELPFGSAKAWADCRTTSIVSPSAPLLDAAPRQCYSSFQDLKEDDISVKPASRTPSRTHSRSIESLPEPLGQCRNPFKEDDVSVKLASRTLLPVTGKRQHRGNADLKNDQEFELPGLLKRHPADLECGGQQRSPTSGSRFQAV